MMPILLRRSKPKMRAQAGSLAGKQKIGTRLIMAFPGANPAHLRPTPVSKTLNNTLREQLKAVT
ncbi:MAG: hypothetical protein JNM65_10410 [Verrucomicrobiaceae bacterium]|nr:hypothetical protein [Verrucomicrobiaceae bacterium]